MAYNKMQSQDIKQKERQKVLNVKIKKKKRSRRKFRIIRRKINRKSRINLKSEQCGKIIDEKTCQICARKQEDEKMVLCDQCDDAYHWPCLGLQQSQIDADIWLCPNCFKSRQEAIQQAKREPESCFKCNKGINDIRKLKYLCQGVASQLILKPICFIQCLKCKNHFHVDCFSIRSNSVNCWDCEIKIRKEGPRNHEQHLNFLKNQLVQVHEKGYFQLIGGANSTSKVKRALCMEFKLFQELTDWELITRYQASLHYALKSRDLIFTDQQVYSSQQIMALNDSDKEIIQVHPLHLQDQKVYEFFKAKIRRGAVVPIQIKEDRILGFYIAALAFIEKGTILSQYTGQVLSLRDSLTEQQHDSIFTLLMTGSSKGDLNIVPKLFGNMSRFVCGVNNKEREHLKRVNVKSVRFSHQNRMRIVFIAKRSIEMGQTLYLDYNAGAYEEYPTSNFV